MVLSRSARLTLTLFGVVVALCVSYTTFVRVSASGPSRVRHTETLVRSSSKERVGLSSLTFTEKATLCETRTIMEE